MFLKYFVKAAIKEEPRDVPFYPGGEWYFNIVFKNIHDRNKHKEPNMAGNGTNIYAKVRNNLRL
jgi:hypothetical protein